MTDELPSWIDAEAWAGFAAMRKAKGKSIPFTDRAAKLIVRELGRLRDAGEDPNACLDQSTMHGWSGVFPVKNRQAKRAPAETYREKDDRLARERAAQWAPGVAKRAPDDTEATNGSAVLVVRH